jgi:competence ComEA-like helix-hairpin-helix protein
MESICRRSILHLRRALLIATATALALTVSGPIFDGAHAHASELKTKASKRRPGRVATKVKRRPQPRPSKTRHLGKVNLNSADLDVLMKLPGVGPTKAKRIVLWRLRRGPFKKIVQLRRVRGFGRKTVARLAPYLTLTEPTTLRAVRGAL